MERNIRQNSKAPRPDEAIAVALGLLKHLAFAVQCIRAVCMCNGARVLMRSRQHSTTTTSRSEGRVDWTSDGNNSDGSASDSDPWEVVGLSNETVQTERTAAESSWKGADSPDSSWQGRNEWYENAGWNAAWDKGWSKAWDEAWDTRDTWDTGWGEAAWASAQRSQRNGRRPGHRSLVWVRLGDLCFSQCSVSPTFSCGRTLQETANELMEDKGALSSIPEVDVVNLDSKLVSMDNRRLYAFRLAFQDDATVPVRMYRDAEQYGINRFSKKFSTVYPNEMVRIRGDGQEVEEVDLATLPVREHLPEIRRISGVRTQLQGDKLLLQGSRREIEEALREVRRIVGHVGLEREVIQLPPHSGRYLKKHFRGVKKLDVDEAADTLTVCDTLTKRQELHEQIQHLAVMCRELDVPDELRPRLIGKGGTTLRELLGECDVVVDIGKDSSVVRVAGPAAQVLQVVDRMRQFLRDNTRISKEIAHPFGARGYLMRKLKTCREPGGARIWLDEKGTHAVATGTRAQIGRAEELLSSLLLDFCVVKLLVNPHLVGEVIGKGGEQLKTLKGGRDVDVQFNSDKDRDKDNSGMCSIMGQKCDVMLVVQDIFIHLQKFTISALRMTAQLAVPHAFLKAFKDGLQIRVDQHRNPWIVWGPPLHVQMFEKRLRDKFPFLHITKDGNHPCCQCCCPGCHTAFDGFEELTRHLQSSSVGCAIRACVGRCGAWFMSDRACGLHEEACPRIHRCPACNRAFGSVADISEHARREECSARLCMGCQHVALDEAGLTSHQKSCAKYQKAKLAQDVKQHISELESQLCFECRLGRRAGSDCAVCKRFLREMQKRWHPDKVEAERKAVANKVFHRVTAFWTGDHKIG
eukprot:TRINITY_DN45076_c0_g1_i1.p1 TRINITY_DN45076_c0_g1~~TRINITY_DN45076_c0_g1_i1.p1  ORF type:complete len:864 (+),score=129.02 TRINITY_DN45076_c0_g1_i1:148-2739(+)